MKVLIVGSGGREHAIAWKVAQSKQVEKIYCAPGNAGIEEYAECVNIGAMEFDRLTQFAEEKKIDLTVVGMDDPLVGGIVNAFEEKELRVFGPRQLAAMIEGSKAFSKDLMKKYHIPTAAYENFDDPQKALEYLETAKMPIVLKADGLALGKGVLICNTLEEAKAGVKTIMEDKQFGAAGNRMVIEEFMTGREVSVLCFCDGTHVVPMTSAQDHKRAKDGDQGLNTGGMGTFSPSPFYTPEIAAFCEEKIYKPTMAAMKAEGRDFVGILFDVKHTDFINCLILCGFQHRSLEIHGNFHQAICRFYTLSIYFKINIVKYIRSFLAFFCFSELVFYHTYCFFISNTAFRHGICFQNCVFRKFCFRLSYSCNNNSFIFIAEICAILSFRFRLSLYLSLSYRFRFAFRLGFNNGFAFRLRNSFCLTLGF